MKKFLLVIALVLLVPLFAFAVNTTTVSTNNRTITITGLDDNWTWSTDLSSEDNEVKHGQVWAIIFYPSAQSDRMIIHDGGIDTGVAFDSGLASGSDDPRIMYYPPGAKMELVIDITDCTLSTPASAKVIIMLR